MRVEFKKYRNLILIIEDEVKLWLTLDGADRLVNQLVDALEEAKWPRSQKQE